MFTVLLVFEWIGKQKGSNYVELNFILVYNKVYKFNMIYSYYLYKYNPYEIDINNTNKNSH